MQYCKMWYKVYQAEGCRTSSLLLYDGNRVDKYWTIPRNNYNNRHAGASKAVFGFEISIVSLQRGAQSQKDIVYSQDAAKKLQRWVLKKQTKSLFRSTMLFKKKNPYQINKKKADALSIGIL